MSRRDPGGWMWAEAVDLLEQAERLRRQFFRLAGAPEHPSWEPPIDLYRRGDELLIEVALPGVAPDRIDVQLCNGELVVRARRDLPVRSGGAAILRLEIPHGQFERRLGLPDGVYHLVARESRDGCLQLLLSPHRRSLETR